MDNLKEWAQALQDSMNFSKAVIEEAADRLAAYEDAEERGELVRVVRCKDCVHWTESQTSAEYGICEKDAPLRWSDFWCAEAEKREVDNGSV